MKSILLLLWAGLLPLIGVGQASPYSRTAIEQVPVGDLREDLMGKWAIGAPGANQLILVTPDSLPEALQKMQQLVESKGYQVAERTPTMLTTASKHVQGDEHRYVLSRTWFFFRKWKPAPDPPVSFRLRIRAFRLPMGTQLQLVGAYIHEGCAECVGSDECIGRAMQEHDFDAERRPYRPSWDVAPPTPFGVIWESNCFEKTREVAKLYRPRNLYLGYVRWYTTTGDRSW